MNKLYALQLNFLHKLAIFMVILSLFLDLGFPKTVVAEDAIRADFKQESSFPVASNRQPRKVVMAVMTVYTSTVDQTDDSPFIAANGKRVYDGLVAANWLPFGTHVKFPDLYGDKIFTINDRMNEKYGYGRADIWLDTSKAEAMKFGVQRLKMEIY